MGACTVAFRILRDHRGGWRAWPAHCGRWCGIIAAVLTATSTLLILKALNARPYELSALLVTLCAVALFKWLDDARARWLWAFSISGDTGHGHAVVRTARPSLNAHLCFGRTPEAACSALARFACTHCSSCRGLRGLDCRKHRGSGPGELDRAGIGWKPTDCRAPRSCSRSGIRPRHLCRRGPRCGQTCCHLESGRPPCRRRTDRSRPGHLCPHHRMGDPSHGGSVNRLVRPSRLRQSVRHRHQPPAPPCSWPSSVCACSQRRWIQPALPMGQGNRRLRGRTLAFIGVVAAVVLATSYVSSASALQEDLQGTARYVALHAQSGDVIALPDHAITAVSWLLPGERRSTRSPLATAWRSTALCRRNGSLT